jgi:hypothetical protein
MAAAFLIAPADHRVRIGLARSAPLELDRSDRRARKTARLAAGEKRQKIECTDRRLELRTGVTRRCGRRDLGRLRHSLLCSGFVRYATARMPYPPLIAGRYGFEYLQFYQYGIDLYGYFQTGI